MEIPGASIKFILSKIEGSCGDSESLKARAVAETDGEEEKLIPMNECCGVENFVGDCLKSAQEFSRPSSSSRKSSMSKAASVSRVNKGEDRRCEKEIDVHKWSCSLKNLLKAV